MTEDISVLKNLLNLPDEDLKSIHKNLNENSKDIQMLDYIYKIDLEEDNINNILKLQKNNVPAVREKYFEDYRKMVKASRTLEYNLTNLRLNPYTEFENNPYGMYYDYIYMVALYQNKEYHELIKDYYFFTDLFFNPNKSLNTQARAIAIFKTLYDNDYLKLLEDVSEFKKYYKENVKLKIKKY